MEPNLKFEHQQNIDYENLPEKIKDLMKIPQYEQRSDQWFAARAKMLTASNLDSVLGRNKYSCREEILFKKCGLSVPFMGNKFTQHGCDTEDHAIAEYCRIYNKKTIDFGLLPHPTIEFLGGSPDGIAFDNGDPNSKPIVLEVKCPFRKKNPGVIPKQYFNQLILNMVIADCDGVFIEYYPHGHVGQDYFLNIIHLKLEDHVDHFVTNNVPVFNEFWDEVLHYRNVGIETHPRYSHWDRKCNPKKKLKTLNITSTSSMFVD